MSAFSISTFGVSKLPQILLLIYAVFAYEVAGAQEATYFPKFKLSNAAIPPNDQSDRDAALAMGVVLVELLDVDDLTVSDFKATGFDTPTDRNRELREVFDSLSVLVNAPSRSMAVRKAAWSALTYFLLELDNRVAKSPEESADKLLSELEITRDDVKQAIEASNQPAGADPLRETLHSEGFRCLVSWLSRFSQPGDSDFESRSRLIWLAERSLRRSTGRRPSLALEFLRQFGDDETLKEDLIEVMMRPPKDRADRIRQRSASVLLLYLFGQKEVLPLLHSTSQSAAGRVRAANALAFSYRNPLGVKTTDRQATFAAMIQSVTSDDPNLRQASATAIFAYFQSHKDDVDDGELGKAINAMAENSWPATSFDGSYDYGGMTPEEERRAFRIRDASYEERNAVLALARFALERSNVRVHELLPIETSDESLPQISESEQRELAKIDGQLLAVQGLLDEFAQVTPLEFNQIKQLRAQIEGYVAPSIVWLKAIVALIAITALVGVWWSIAKLRPLWLLWLLQIRVVVAPIKMSVPYVGPVEFSLVNSPLKYLIYHPRVLDAWIAKHGADLYEQFQAIPLVSSRKFHVPLPVAWGNEPASILKVSRLRSEFSRGRTCVLIHGEGGSGKTTIACQIARWAFGEMPGQQLAKFRMLPIYVEDDIVPRDAKDALVEFIQGRLQAQLRSVNEISSSLVVRLLNTGRFLVIVDRYAELCDETRHVFSPASPKFPIRNLVIVSRRNESLGGVPLVAIETRKIATERLAQFLEEYTTMRRRVDLLSDKSFKAAIGRLSRIVHDQEIVVLLAKLYLEQIFVAKDEQRPLNVEDIPDLLLQYINSLNHNVDPNNREPDHKVHNAAMTVAWQCVKSRLHPRNVRVDELVSRVPGEMIDYLETRLLLLRKDSPSNDKIGFALEPLAEFLAAMHVVRSNKDQMQEWRTLFEAIDRQATEGNRELIIGFLLALRDCCLSKFADPDIPDFVLEDVQMRIDTPTGRLAQGESVVATGDEKSQITPREPEELPDDKVTGHRTE